MVVDNHPLILHFVVDFMEKQGHEVIPAEDALAALHLLREKQPEIIFIDLIMPKISGEHFCRIIRSKPEFRDIYLIILSAIAAEEQTAIAAFGADACVAKGPLAGMAAHLEEVLRQIDSGTLRQKEMQVIGLKGIYHRQITRELLSAKCHLENILGHIAEGILEVTDRGEVIYANLVAQKLFNLPEEVQLTGGLCDLFPEEQRERLAAILKEQPSAGRCETMPVVPYGEKFLDLTLLPMADGHAHSTLVVIRDITTPCGWKTPCTNRKKSTVSSSKRCSMASSFLRSPSMMPARPAITFSWK